MPLFQFNETYLSQIPALQTLITLGYKYLSPQEALDLRHGKTSHVLLEEVLHEQLSKINRIRYRGREHCFSEDNIQEAVQRLKNIRCDGLQKTNELSYDLITLGTALEQTVGGHSKSFSFNYIDWKHPANNQFHIVSDYAVQRFRSSKIVRPDIVLFVNGIPLAVIESKSPNVDVMQAVSQNIRNQCRDYIPTLFTYVQLVMSINKNKAYYATTGTPSNFWSVWRELEDDEGTVASVINTVLRASQTKQLFSGRFASARQYFDALEQKGERLVTEQDKAIYSLCRPERLLTLTYRFILFESGIKKIARYQQFFVVRSALSRVKHVDAEGKRSGGIIWHTQGSGKTLTMVMLARALVLEKDIKNPRVILVTDRDELDKQLGNTFLACGLSQKRATSGRTLVEHLKNKVDIVTTLIHKFEKGWVSESFSDDSSDIFVLIDESHRTNFGSLAANMRRMLPNACYIGFTGTPLLKKEKNSFVTFGKLIEPHYSIKQAVNDKVVVPLAYEGRHTDIMQNQDQIDRWFERHTSGLNRTQKADLKRKYARIEVLNQSDQVIYQCAFDVSEHYRANWQGSSLKGQLVASTKAQALKYHEYLKDIGRVTSEVIISAPDMREGYEKVDESPIHEVNQFWKDMMTRFGSEGEYTRQIINRFKHSQTPEILIVVDKLLTGFDAPRNTVLYLCRKLKEHTLLQAIARVNRLYENKEVGYIIDYASVLGELDKAFTLYDALAGFDEKDLEGILISINEQVQQLPQRHAELWDVFCELNNQHDEEAFERLLADDKQRAIFYDRLSEYSKTLAIALSSNKFIMEADEAMLARYKSDLKRFYQLKSSVTLRYADALDARDYNPHIKKLFDTHIQASNIIQLNTPVNIFDDEHFESLKLGQGIHSGRSAAAKADTIAHATKKAACEKMNEDPAFYEKFSKLIQNAIDSFKAFRISDLDYLSQVTDMRDKVVLKHRDDVPECISGNDEACAYYGVVRPYFMSGEVMNGQIEAISVETSLLIQSTFEKYWKVDFWTDDRAQSSAINDIDDFLFDDVKNKFGITLSEQQMDEIIEKTMRIAQSRRDAHSEQDKTV